MPHNWISIGNIVSLSVDNAQRKNKKVEEWDPTWECSHRLSLTGRKWEWSSGRWERLLSLFLLVFSPPLSLSRSHFSAPQWIVYTCCGALLPFVAGFVVHVLTPHWGFQLRCPNHRAHPLLHIELFGALLGGVFLLLGSFLYSWMLKHIGNNKLGLRLEEGNIFSSTLVSFPVVLSFFYDSSIWQMIIQVPRFCVLAPLNASSHIEYRGASRQSNLD